MPHKAITGWSRLHLSLQMTPCLYKLLLGIAYYLRLRNKQDMSLAVLLMYDCSLRQEEQRSLTKRNVILTETEHKQILLLLSETKTRRNQGVIFRVKVVHGLLLQRLRKIDDLNRKFFPFSKNDFCRHVHQFMQEYFLLEKSGFINAPVLSTMLERRGVID